jgi:hypothetical protein
MRVLGFQKEDIYVHPDVLSPQMEACVGVVLITQGIEYSAFIGDPEDGTDRLKFLETEWDTFCKKMSDLPKEKAEYIYKKSHAWKHKSDLLMSMLTKGLVFPYKDHGLLN